MARSEEEIHREYPELMIVPQLPKWMTEDDYRDLLDRQCHDIDGQPWGSWSRHPEHVICDGGGGEVAGDAVTERRRWPQRFRVTVHTNNGNSVHYGVTTWLSAEKAIAMAVEAHVDRYHPGTGPMGVNDVEVADLGPVRRADDGTMLIDKSDLVDRMEF